tara:strand:- start:1042 stop:1497 length:456 start_codon:yes stop_codon:yes gene_type:complete
MGIFEDIATKHHQLQKYETGELSDVDLEKMDATNFPLLFVEPNNVSVNSGASIITLDFMVMELVQSDEANITDAYSECLQICNDIIAEFEQILSACSFVGASTHSKYVLQKPVNLLPFTRRFSNLLTGWGGSISIEVDSELNLGIAPIEQS